MAIKIHVERKGMDVYNCAKTTQAISGDEDMQSIWQRNVSLLQFPRLEKDIQTDVLIIGGGLCGLLCAHLLQEAGVRYVLLEAGNICGGTTAHTTAKITTQHGLLYAKLEQRYGIQTASSYYQIQSHAAEHLRALAQAVDCDYETVDAYLYARDTAKKLHKELRTLHCIGVPVRYVKNVDLPFPVAGALCMSRQGQFHPLKFANGILARLCHENIYEHSAVRAYDGMRYCTHQGSVRAEKTIVATHFPIWNKHGAYYLKMYQHRSYVLALQGASAVNGVYLDADKTGLSFRMYGPYLLLGGGSHRTGQQGGGFSELEAVCQTLYPTATVAYQWAAQDCMTLDGMPYIGLYGKHTPGLFVASGFNKWGMTGAMAAAEVLCDMILQKGKTAGRIFSPQRSIWHPQLLCNGVHAIWGLLRPTCPRCPHMGCALQWNAQEHTWDCPCHGSRFAQNGDCLEGPATGSLDLH